MGRILRIEVENFKSYKGFVTIGPFKNFTAIIGPNGAGKSNLMDAISFVVGVRTRHLRSENLKDLIYNADGQVDVEQRRAQVTLIYEPSTSEVSNVKSGEQLMFTRMISNHGVSNYKLQGKNVTWDQYNSRLKDIGVLVKARNFLVFQGDVESIASKSPKDLTKYFEEISSSGELAAEYDRLKAEKDSAETDTIYTFQQKKGVLMEKKQVREQKEEAERFNKKTAEKEQKTQDFFLWQLFHIEEDLKQHKESVKDIETNVAEMSVREDNVETQLEEKKQAHAACHKLVVQHEKQLRKAKDQWKKAETESIRLKEEASHGKRVTDDKAKQVDELKESIEKYNVECEGLTHDIAQLKAAQKQLSKAKDTQPTNSLTDEQMEELNQLRIEIKRKTIEEQTKLKNAETELENAKDQLKLVEDKIKRDTQKMNDDSKTLTKFEERYVATKQSMGQDSVRIEELKEERQKKAAEINELRERRDTVKHELQLARDKLRKFKDIRNDNRRERDMADDLEKLSSHFSGVKGRLTDLVQPRQRQFNHAILSALGRFGEGIVVDKWSTAKECIRYLKEHHRRHQMFLPLDNLHPRRVDERLRQLGREYHLATDMLEYDEEIEKAVQVAIGGTVICQNLNDARKLCFTRRVNCKAVSLEGHIIARNGDMTGGGSKHGTDVFEKREVEAAKKQKEKLERELDEIDSKIDYGGRNSGGRQRRNTAPGVSILNEIDNNIARLDTKRKYAMNQIESLETKIRECKVKLKETEAEVAAKRPKKQELEVLVQQQQKVYDNMEEEVAKVSEKYTKEFAEKYNINDVREYEKRFIDQKKSLDEKIDKVSNHITTMSDQLAYTEQVRKKAKKSYELAKKKLETENKLMVKKEKEYISASNKMNELQSKLDEFNSQKSKLRQDEKDAQTEVSEVEKAKEEFSTEKTAQMKKLSSEQSKIEKLRAARHDLLRQAHVEQVKLPTIGGGTTTGHKRQHESDYDGDSQSKKSKMDDSADNDVEMGESNSTSQDPTGSLGFSQDESKFVKKDDAETADLDFSGLSENLNSMNEKEREQLKKEYERELKEIQEELEKMQPNMKAQERYEDVNKRLKSTEDKLNEARNQSRAVETSFDMIKQQRLERFMKMFDHVETTIDRIYKDLTKSTKHTLGGNAYLTLNNTEEPWLGGIKFNAMPPTKRFRDMEQLSGGEKTVAALALLFAIHSFHPAPFFVMDEVDAALDNVNVFKVSNYIKQNSNNFQCLVISLKDAFYDKADALVGIYREKEMNCSRAATMDLTKYDNK